MLWHKQDRDRVTYCVAVQAAEDASFAKSVDTLFNNDYGNLLGLGHGADQLYYETNQGTLLDGQGEKARYIRCYSRGNSDDRLNWYREVESMGITREMSVAPVLRPNRPAGGNAGAAVRFAPEAQWPGVRQPGC